MILEADRSPLHRPPAPSRALTPRPGAGLQPCRSLIALLALLASLPGAPCRAGAPAAADPPSGVPLVAPAAIADCPLEPPGYVRGPVFGAIGLEMDWAPPQLRCDGMIRPQPEGIRLFFALTSATDEGLTLVLGVHGQPEALAGREWPASVTLIAEGRSQFFSSGGPDRCWTQVHELRPQHAGPAAPLRVAGRLYCVGALPSLNDRSSITLGDIEYAGLVRRDEP